MNNYVFDQLFKADNTANGQPSILCYSDTA